MPQRPNILYLHSHDTGRYIAPYGYAVHTPNLQKLAERGMLFRHAFTANPTCSPSRACLLTSRCAHNNGMLGLAHRGSALSDPAQTLPSYLHGHGYETVLTGVQHVARHDVPASDYGYSRDVRHEPTPDFTGAGVNDQQTVHRVEQFLKGWNADKPLFLDVGFFTTHRTGTTPEGVQWHNGPESPAGDPRDVRPPACLPDTAETRADFADYAVAVTRLDDYMGRVLDALDQAGLAENTLIICTTDHGIAFPHMKCNLTDHGLGVMLTLAGPAGNGQRFDGGCVSDSLVSQIDLFPTVCDAVGLDKPDSLQGVSLSPLAADEHAKVRDEVFAEVNYHAAHEPKRAVRTDRYKYIRRVTVREHPVLPNCDPGVSKDLLLAQGWRQRPQEAERLYDLAYDPQETCNRIDDPAYAEAAQQMRDKLEQWMRDTNDPALTGKVHLPGYQINPADGMHPGQDDLVTER
ncbi:MAG: sulfatase-like hydrolase/transferase [Planctomycetes bacterium]|jgi:arylsulfatase A-like enzyme|nr:sulfatase-like hydrolase/transferase [Planctomycetota bacterium]